MFDLMFHGAGTSLFLLNISTNMLTGVFEAAGRPQVCIHAYRYIRASMASMPAPILWLHGSVIRYIA